MQFSISSIGKLQSSSGKVFFSAESPPQIIYGWKRLVETRILMLSARAGDARSANATRLNVRRARIFPACQTLTRFAAEVHATKCCLFGIKMCVLTSSVERAMVYSGDSAPQKSFLDHNCKFRMRLMLIWDARFALCMRMCIQIMHSRVFRTWYFSVCFSSTICKQKCKHYWRVCKVKNATRMKQAIESHTSARAQCSIMH